MNDLIKNKIDNVYEIQLNLLEIIDKTTLEIQAKFETYTNGLDVLREQFNEILTVYEK